MLRRHRRPWPEWSELERRVAEGRFEIGVVGPHVFLVEEKSRDGRLLSRKVTARGEELVPRIAAPFPAWLTGLVGVDAHEDLSCSGALAADLWPPTRPRVLGALPAWQRGCEVRAKDPDASRVYVLQRNRSGTPLFSDGRNVLAWAWEKRAFDRVASLDVFLRFCLRQLLAGEDWWAAWTRGDGAAEGIRPPIPG